MPKITCCKSCTERHENCWSMCERYKAQKNAEDHKPDDRPYEDYINTVRRRISHYQHVRKRK